MKVNDLLPFLSFSLLPFCTRPCLQSRCGATQIHFEKFHSRNGAFVTAFSEHSRRAIRPKWRVVLIDSATDGLRYGCLVRAPARRPSRAARDVPRNSAASLPTAGPRQVPLLFASKRERLDSCAWSAIFPQVLGIHL